MIVRVVRTALRVVGAGGRAASAVARERGVGRVHPLWVQRASVCQTCPLCVVKCGKSYCGKPFLNQIERDEPTEGCGCPVVPKAKDPTEHCPRNAHFEPSSKSESCDCIWCTRTANAD